MNGQFITNGNSQELECQLQIEKLESLNGQVKYLEDALEENLENWEKKEYQEVLKDTKVELEKQQQHINLLKEEGYIK